MSEQDEGDMSPEQIATRERQSQDAFERMAKHLADEHDRRDMYRDAKRAK